VIPITADPGIFSPYTNIETIKLTLPFRVQKRGFLSEFCTDTLSPARGEGRMRV